MKALTEIETYNVLAQKVFKAILALQRCAKQMLGDTKRLLEISEQVRYL